ncbi:hypothetical protein CCY01nite_40130 [Chitinophaga cymbidii]|uniref:Uncharacterized protein n=2 Tax=Chitinophaga cymbidii TaxID=1096750 RepID=A0A512RPX5_9BACT|nr:hypothetical protein CCY01nite_40130 [Chitinophaga cymbidii]
MHSIIPHVHHDPDDLHMHVAHDHTDGQGHAHDHDRHQDDESPLEHAFAHLSHNGGEYEIFGREKAITQLQQHFVAAIRAHIFSYLAEPVVFEVDLPVPGSPPLDLVPIIFLTPIGLRAPPAAFHA